MKRIVMLTFLVGACCVTSAFGWSETFTNPSNSGINLDLGRAGYDTGGAWYFQATNGSPNYSLSTTGNELRITSPSLPSPYGTGADSVAGIVTTKTYTGDVTMGGWINMDATTDVDNTEGFLFRANLGIGNAYGLTFSREWGSFNFIKIVGGTYTDLGTAQSVAPSWDSKYYVELWTTGSTLSYRVLDSTMTQVAADSITDTTYTSGNTGFIAAVDPNPTNSNHPNTGIPSTIDSTFDTLFATSLPGDANGDGKVDVSDLGILAANYGSSGKNWLTGDFNHDGKIDVSDLGILAANYGSSGGSVPEPATLSLLAISGLALLRKNH